MKFTLKSQIYILLFSIVGFITYTIYYNAKTHVEAVEVADELVVQKDSLDKTVKVLIHTQDSVLSKIETLDSVLTSKDSVIDTQKNRIGALKRSEEELKTRVVTPIIIRDTIYITEKKNFWGRTKKSIESVSDTTIMMEEMEEETTIDSTENK